MLLQTLGAISYTARAFALMFFIMFYLLCCSPLVHYILLFLFILSLGFWVTQIELFSINHCPDITCLTEYQGQRLIQQLILVHYILGSFYYELAFTDAQNELCGINRCP